MKTERKATTVLLVDDERAYRQAVSEVLNSQGYTVVQAGSAAEALQVLNIMTPELILLDVMMPEVDGLTLLRQLSVEPRFLSVPIVMASAKAQAADRWSAWERGASAYLAKPFTFDEVTSLVEYLLAPSDSAEASTEASAEVPFEMLHPTALMQRGSAASLAVLSVSTRARFGNTAGGPGRVSAHLRGPRAALRVARGFIHNSYRRRHGALGYNPQQAGPSGWAQGRHP